MRTRAFTQLNNHHITFSKLSFSEITFGTNGHLISFEHSATDDSEVRISDCTFAKNTNAFIQLLNLDTAAIVPSKLVIERSTFLQNKAPAGTLI